MAHDGWAMTTLTSFAATHGLSLTVNERTSRKAPRYWVMFKTVEVMTAHGTLVALYGEGSTPEAATADYAAKLAGQRVVIRPYSAEQRREARVA